MFPGYGELIERQPVQQTGLRLSDATARPGQAGLVERHGRRPDALVPERRGPEMDVFAENVDAIGTTSGLLVRNAWAVPLEPADWDRLPADRLEQMLRDAKGDGQPPKMTSSSPAARRRASDARGAVGIIQVVDVDLPFGAVQLRLRRIEQMPYKLSEGDVFFTPRGADGTSPPPTSAVARPIRSSRGMAVKQLTPT